MLLRRIWNRLFVSHLTGVVILVAFAIRAHTAAAEEPTSAPPEVAAGTVLVEVHEGVPEGKKWDFELPPARESFTHSALALVGFPKKYVSPGVIADRTNPYLARLHAVKELP